jgi:hypothetical protein
MSGVLVSVVLDKPRNLKLTLGAMKAFEKAVSKNAFTLDWKNLSATELSALLWASIIHEDKSLTIEQVDNMIDSSNMMEVIGKLAQAWKMAHEDDEASPLATA